MFLVDLYMHPSIELLKMIRRGVSKVRRQDEQDARTLRMFSLESVIFSQKGSTFCGNMLYFRK